MSIRSLAAALRSSIFVQGRAHRAGDVEHQGDLEVRPAVAADLELGGGRRLHPDAAVVVALAAGRGAGFRALVEERVEDAEEGRPDPRGGGDLELGVLGVRRELDRAGDDVLRLGLVEVGRCRRGGLVDGVGGLDLGDAAGCQRGRVERRLRLGIDAVDLAEIDGEADERGQRNDQQAEGHAHRSGAVAEKAADQPPLPTSAGLVAR